MSTLAGAVEGVTGSSLEELSSAELGHSIVALREVVDRLEAESCRRVAEFDRRRGWAAAGATSVVDWLKRHCRLPGGAAAQRAEVARELAVLPGAVEAFRSGEIGFHQAAVLARTVTEVGREAAPAAAAGLVAAAERIDPDRLRILSRELRHTVDPQGAVAAALRHHDRRRLRLGECLDGMYSIDGLLDAEGGALVRTALDAMMAPIPNDPRTAEQRRADATVEVCRRHLQRGDLPSSGGQRPHLVITVAKDTLCGSANDAVASLLHGGPIGVETARRYACDAAVTVVSLTADGTPFETSRTMRTAPPAMRRALEVRDRGCVVVACGRPPSWCDAHHVEHWIETHVTDVPGMVLLCGAHHRAVHELAGTLVARGDGTYDIRPP